MVATTIASSAELVELNMLHTNGRKNSLSICRRLTSFRGIPRSPILFSNRKDSQFDERSTLTNICMVVIYFLTIVSYYFLLLHNEVF